MSISSGGLIEWVPMNAGSYTVTVIVTDPGGETVSSVFDAVAYLADCAGVPNGFAVEDNCGICDTDYNNDCVQDCSGVWGGSVVEDDCGVCGGDNSSCADCAGVPNGFAVADNCGICDTDYNNDCEQDCSGVWGGSVVEDDCGVCGGDNSSCGVPTPDCDWIAGEVWDGTACLTAAAAPPSTAVFGDLNCDETVNVNDVQLSIIVALGLPLNAVLDADQDGAPDKCPASVSCGIGTVLEDGACVALVTQAHVDTAYEEGVASVDITTDNQAAFDEGVASVEPAGCDLSFANLTGANLTNADLSFANLTGADLTNADLNSVDLSSTELTNADLSNVVWLSTLCPDETYSDDNGGTCCGHLNGAIPAAGCD